MLYYHWIDVSEGTDINKTIASKECNIYHYWYILDKEFKSQLYICNGCHDVLMMSIRLSDIDILKVHGVDIAVVSPELAKVKPWIYCKKLI